MKNRAKQEFQLLCPNKRHSHHRQRFCENFHELASFQFNSLIFFLSANLKPVFWDKTMQECLSQPNLFLKKLCNRENFHHNCLEGLQCCFISFHWNHGVFPCMFRKSNEFLCYDVLFIFRITPLWPLKMSYSPFLYKSLKPEKSNFSQLLYFNFGPK